MRLTFCELPSKRKTADVVIVPFWVEGVQVKMACTAKEFSTLSSVPIKAKDFLAKADEIALLYKPSGKEKRVILLGLGRKSEITLESLRRCYSSAVRFSRKKKWGVVSFFFPEMGKESEEHVLAAMEGSILSNYAYDQLKRETVKLDPTFLVKEIQCVGIDEKIFASCKKQALVIESVQFTRDLINGNADDVTADVLASHAKEMAGGALKVKVLRKKELEKEKMGLLLAVNQGAIKEPALIVLEYFGDPKSKEITAIVGKGITYDTGGLNIKVGGSMDTMKCDMSGSAAVLGTIQAAKKLSLKCNIIGIIASAENAIGPGSYKPGDVYISHSGKSVEINDTDAEGRLVLADALSYLQTHYTPTRIIDLATLTGGVVIALGEEASGLFCNNDTLAGKLVEAGEKTFERVWRLPLYSEYKDGLKSSIADMKNSGGRKASPCKGAAFLQQFIKNQTPWAHLDIAGTAYLTETRTYHPTLATGVGVRLLIQFLESL
ncbi:MAG: leucyl aminopeptidase [Chlamydiae bacterium]|nr:leucyl aminopeptidase [Chlamydiota bacterium]